MFLFFSFLWLIFNAHFIEGRIYLHGTKEQWRHTLEYDKLVLELHHTKTGS